MKVTVAPHPADAGGEALVSGNATASSSTPHRLGNIRPFYRKVAFRAALGGIGESLFDELRTAGRIPEPDGYISERVPIWCESTVESVQAEFLARPNRRRGAL